MRSLVGLGFLVLVLGAGAAGAQTVAATCGTGYSNVPGSKCLLLGTGLSQTDGQTTAGPVVLNVGSNEKFAKMCVGYGNADAACEPGTSYLKWSGQTGAGAPAVWHDFATLTGVGSAFVSAWCGPILGPNLMAVLDGDSNGSESAIVDTDCNNSGKVSIIIELLP